MFNRSEILRKAWTFYRTARPAFFAKGDAGTKRMFLRFLFAKMLRRAWEEAKKAATSLAATAAAFVDAQRRVQAAAVAALDPMVRSARIVEIRSELQVLDYAPLGVRTSQRRHNLGAELSLLQTTAA
ncbi:hypothetical protein [Devosia sp. CN2-171]|uniref:hypothetical protein n=1 Tax=Devosia sp. CN2-171 TaxID=3400909 RepID=UPI003BF7E1AF